jgi:hypothetical protein
LKFWGRLGYAVVVTLLFLWVLNFSSGLRMTMYVQKNGNAALAEENPTYFFFYSSVPDYHCSVPLFSFDDDAYSVRLFEIATIESTDPEIVIEEYGYLMIHPKEGSTSEIYTIELLQGDTLLSDWNAIQYRNLNLLVGINDEGSIYIGREYFKESAADRLILKNATGEILMDIEFSSEEFRINNAVDEYFEAEDALPEGLALQDESVFPAIPQIDQEFDYLFWVLTGGYIGLVFIVTYFLFFFRKKSRKLPLNQEPSVNETPEKSQP